MDEIDSSPFRVARVPESNFICISSIVFLDDSRSAKEKEKETPFRFKKTSYRQRNFLKDTKRTRAVQTYGFLNRLYG